MKGEYLEQKTDNNNLNTTHNMFAKFPHHPKFQPPPPPHHFPPPHLHPHHPLLPENSDSTTATPPSQPPPHHHSPPQQPYSKKPKNTPLSNQPTTSNDDGGTIEVPRRPRGRPPGSKNKPKPPVIITREPEPAMSPYILEIPNGSEIVDSLTRFTRRRGVGLCVLTASGAVANVTFKQPSTSTTSGGTVTFHGRFEILSLSAVVVINTMPFNCSGGFTISLAGPQGQIVGGKVVGSLVCSGTVYVIAASFNNPTYCRLPIDDEQDNGQSQQPPLSHHNYSDDQETSPVSGGGGGGGGGGGTMNLYGGVQLGGATSSATASEVIWATPSSVRPPY